MLKRTLLVVLLVVFPRMQVVFAQPANVPGSKYSGLYSYVLRKYGLDHELINGIQFNNTYHRIQNHPYILDITSIPGTVTLSGKKYRDVLLNYDLYAQQLILEYNNLTGGLHKIILSPDQTDAFTLDQFLFQKLNLDAKGLLFYQVIRVNDMVLFVHWKKELQVTSNDLQYAEYFTETRMKYILELEDQRYAIKKKKELLALFQPVQKKMINKYMRQNFIKLDKTGPGELTRLVHYVSSLITDTADQ